MIRRTLQPRLEALAAQYPAVFLTGPRQSGKTTLARTTFPDFAYFSLEDLERRQEAMEDPRGFLRRLEGQRGAILDEVQRAPDLLSYLQGFLDERRGGPLILTGSQHFLLSEGINQSLAGRLALLELHPLSVAELAARPARAPEDFGPAPGERPSLDRDTLLFAGGFPPIHDRHLEPGPWLDAYVRTYVERDVRTLANIGNLDTFTRFLRLCAGRSGQLLNASALAADAGISQPTARSWLSVLRASFIVDVLPPHHENFSKRLVKTPKLYLTDSGLMCHLLGLRRAEDLAVHPLRGAVFETFVVSELRKRFLHHGERPPLYFWRDTHGLEVDALVDLGVRRVALEIKAGETLYRQAFAGLDRYLALAGSGEGVLVYGGAESGQRYGREVWSWADCT